MIFDHPYNAEYARWAWKPKVRIAAGRSATHGGTLCQESVRDWPGDLLWPSGWRGLYCWLSSQAPGFRAVARSGVKLERPQRQRPSGRGRGRTSLRPASGGRRSGSGKAWLRLRVASGAWVRRSGSHIHPFGACLVSGRHDRAIRGRAAQSVLRARHGRLRLVFELARGWRPLPACHLRWVSGAAAAAGCGTASPASVSRCQARVSSLRATAVVAIFLPRRLAMAW